MAEPVGAREAWAGPVCAVSKPCSSWLSQDGQIHLHQREERMACLAVHILSHFQPPVPALYELAVRQRKLPGCGAAFCGRLFLNPDLSRLLELWT